MYSFCRSLLKRLSLIGLLAVLLACFPAFKSEAASLYHIHDDNCYETTQKICTNHYVRTHIETGELKCQSCGKNNSNIAITVYSSVCRDGLIEERNLRAEGTCSACGNGIAYGTSATNEHTYRLKTLSCAIPENTPLAEVNLIKSTEEWTRDGVELYVSESIKLQGLELSYSWSEGLGNQSRISVDNNGAYSVTVTAAGCAPVTLSETVNNIDRVCPIISLKKSTEDWSEKGIDIFVEASDNESGLPEAAYSLSGGEYGASASFHIGANGTYSVSVRDRAGNVATETLSITNVGRDPKLVAAEAEAAKRAEAERLAALAAAEQAAKEKAESEAAAIKAAEEKAKAEKEKAQAERDRALAEKARAEAELKIAEIKKAEGEKGISGGTAEAGENPEEIGAGIDSPETGPALDSLTETESGIMIPLVNEDGLLSSGDTAFKAEEADGDEAETGDFAEAEPLSDSSSEDWYRGISGDLYRQESDDRESALSGMSLLKAGIVLAIMGMFIMSLFSYVYVSENGKKKLITTVRVEKEDKRIIVRIPDKKLRQGERYSLSLSIWRSGNRDRLPIYARIGESENVINVDEGKAFVY